jgi:hypothetical protein
LHFKIRGFSKMKKSLIVVAAFLFIVGLASQSALAQSGTLGCGGGNGATVPCNGQGLGTVTQNGNGSVNGGVDVTFTGVTGLPSLVSSLPVFTPQTDQFEFDFSNVGLTFGDGGTFTFTDLTEGGVLAVAGEAELGGTVPPGLTGTLSLVLDPTAFMFNYGGIAEGGTLSGLTGSANLTLDPGNVTVMTGTIGLPSFTGGGPSPTPEPGTLLLLSSGLPLVGFLRGKFARA